MYVSVGCGGVVWCSVVGCGTCDMDWTYCPCGPRRSGQRTSARRSARELSRHGSRTHAKISSPVPPVVWDVLSGPRLGPRRSYGQFSGLGPIGAIPEDGPMHHATTSKQFRNILCRFIFDGYTWFTITQDAPDWYTCPIYFPPKPDFLRFFHSRH